MDDDDLYVSAGVVSWFTISAPTLLCVYLPFNKRIIQIKNNETTKCNSHGLNWERSYKY
jgi:hypothetical protein